MAENTLLDVDVEEEIESTEQGTETSESTKDETNLDNYIPKSVALQWKKDAKEKEKRIREYEAKEHEQEVASKLSRIKTLALDKGLGEDDADIYAAMAEELYKSIPKKDIETAEIEADIEEYKEFYPGITSVKADIIKTIQRYRKADPDFGVEEAYRLLSPKVKSPREQKIEIEQRAGFDKDNTEPTSSGGVRKKVSKLDAEEQKTLKLMQAQHPDRAWTEEKFIKLMR